MSGPAWDEGAKYTLAVDFDGVIHSYTSPWIDAETIPDPPVPGVIEWMNSMLLHYRIVIFTTRGRERDGRIAVRKYLTEHGFDDPEAEITAVKPAALIYIDDRGFRFDGDAANLPSVEDIRYRLIPWNKGSYSLTEAGQKRLDELKQKRSSP